MSEAPAMFGLLRQSADAKAVDAIERLVADVPDRKLVRINALAFAAQNGLDEERTIAAFLHASKIGLFELSWNVLCPGCSGVLDSNATLKTVHSEDYTCSLCATDYEPTLDQMVEVTFTVSARVRRVPAHNPDDLQPVEYFRQLYFSSELDLPEDFDAVFEEMTLESLDLPAGEKAIVSLQLPAEFIIIFDPVTHTAQFLDVKGEPTKERQTLSIIFEKARHTIPRSNYAPGPSEFPLKTARTSACCLPSSSPGTRFTTS